MVKKQIDEDKPHSCGRPGSYHYEDLRFSSFRGDHVSSLSKEVHDTELTSSSSSESIRRSTPTMIPHVSGVFFQSQRLGLVLLSSVTISLKLRGT